MNVDINYLHATSSSSLQKKILCLTYTIFYALLIV